MTSKAVFVTKVRTPAGVPLARLLIESLQAFGGAMRGCPWWVFAADPETEDCRDLASEQVAVIPLDVPPAIRRYPFGDKVYACSAAEQMAPAGVEALIWIDLECLVVQPPLLFDLGNDWDIALRPVHIRNVGLPPEKPLDAFWRGVYTALGVEDVQSTVEAFIDGQRLRSYFNSHSFALRPGLGLFQRWHQVFERLVTDEGFQAGACQDELHQIFLFQAIFSALAATSMKAERVRMLPPTYNYPYNLHARVPPEKRPAALNDLVTFTFEGRSIHPAAVTDIPIHEPLRSWLSARTAAG